MHRWRCVQTTFVNEEGLMGREIISLERCRINNIFYGVKWRSVFEVLLYVVLKYKLINFFPHLHGKKISLERGEVGKEFRLEKYVSVVCVYSYVELTFIVIWEWQGLSADLCSTCSVLHAFCLKCCELVYISSSSGNWGRSCCFLLRG